MKATQRRKFVTIVGTTALSGVMAVALAPSASAKTAPAPAKPDLVNVLSGYEKLWQPDGQNDLHGSVLSAGPLKRNDMLTSWINRHATRKQQFRALQNSAYTNPDGSGYDQSISIADGLGQNLGKLYAQGRINGKLPLTTALINSETGSAGAFVSTGDAKKHFSYPRPFLAVDPQAKPMPGDSADCAPSKINGSSVARIRKGTPWSDASGKLRINRVAPTVDKTHAFASGDVKLDPQYGDKGLCAGGSFPSGHTTTAYQAGLTLATLLPEVAPSILARTSEAGNNRIVLGVHYPLDIMGGRMSGEASLAALWSDANYRTTVLEPARKELLNYLTTGCRTTMHAKSFASCMAMDRPYRDNPYGGWAMPGGSAQIVTGRKSAVNVYTERMSYGFAPTSSTRLAPVVPKGASNLLLTTFPTLNDAQRTAVLAQTEIPSGNPLAVGAGAGWQRINLAAAMSATVYVHHDGSARVIAVGGPARVITSHGVVTHRHGHHSGHHSKARR